MTDQQHALGILAHQWSRLPDGGWRLVILADSGEIGRLSILVDPATRTPAVAADEIAEQLLHLVPSDELSRRHVGNRP